MLLDLNTRESTVVVIGGQALSELRVKSLMEQGISVQVIASSFTPGLKNLNPRLVHLIRATPSHYPKIIRKVRPSLVLSTLRNHKFNARIVKLAHSAGSLVNVVDSPSLCDFSMPATGSIGKIRLAVATGGLSPAMAGLIRNRLMKHITPEDVLQVELQGQIRKALLARVRTADQRRKIVYRIIRSKKISAFLRRNMFDEASAYAHQLIQDTTVSRRSSKGRTCL